MFLEICGNEDYLFFSVSERRRFVTLALEVHYSDTKEKGCALTSLGGSASCSLVCSHLKGKR